jgi:antitoxin component of RelBE/YafQ-DinJ toxin-antitoxin module
MQTITINVKDDKLIDKVLKMLKSLEKEGLEISSKEDLDDLKLLISTRNEEQIPFEKYLNNENRD